MKKRKEIRLALTKKVVSNLQSGKLLGGGGGPTLYYCPSNVNGGCDPDTNGVCASMPGYRPCNKQ